MRQHAGDGLHQLATRVRHFRRLALILCVLLFAAAPAPAQDAKPGGKDAEEDFKDVDPYTKGEKEALARLGYLRMEPFQLAEGINAQEVVEVLGGIEMLWVETAHFKILSSLKTYKGKGDQRENELLEKEIAQLVKLVPGFKTARPGKLDPWLRLHLYALRLEGLHAQFLERTGYKDTDFPPVGEKGPMGSGPYLGQKLKHVVFLSEKSSTLGRFHRRYLNVDEERSHRYVLPGGATYIGISAQSMRDGGYEPDTALYCALLAGEIANFLDALRDSTWATPLWLDLGMGNWFSRRVDERFTYYANGTSRFIDDDKAHEWEPRVRGLIENDFAYSWRDMLGSLDWGGFTAQQHLIIWSRIDWMLQQKDANLRAFLEPLTVQLTTSLPAEQKAQQIERGVQAFAKGFGKTPEECEAAWKAWVLKTYSRK